MDRRDLVAPVLEICRRLAARLWVANHDGNLTCRLSDGHFLSTPTAVGKGDLTEGDLILVDAEGTRVAGTRKPFSEFQLHRAIYSQRADAGAVLHAHPPHATALAVAGRALDKPFMTEAVVSLGPSVPLVPYADPGPDAVAALMPFATAYDAVLLENHGVLTWGPDLELAYLRMELVEHLARIVLLAEPLGGVRELSEASVAKLMEARKKAGLIPNLPLDVQTPAPVFHSPPVDLYPEVAGASRVRRLSS